MERLRDPETGCPWDLQQDFRSIAPSTLEECYELVHAIEHDDFAHVAEELGDVLFQVVFYAQLGRERHLHSFASITDTLVRKLLRRHPHVFAGGEIEGVAPAGASIGEVQESWESIKQAERDSRSQGGTLDDVPIALPALPRAQKLQKRAARVGFDWPQLSGVLDKVQEELAELRAAVDAGEGEQVEQEMGDVLFSCVNLARHLDVDAEAALRRASGKFERRFRRMEAIAAQRGETLDGLDEHGLDELWHLAKELD